ncbi:MAG: hypothetical protein LQ343_002567 [Gyalolechia ehrenbergii]|nr:MAG: hypothetical protein LQ343_002567 [Gyalolechia ehrenbergii]
MDSRAMDGHVLNSSNSILDAAGGHSFVMNGVLAFAATHLAWLTDSTETKNLAYYHRGIALKGLHEAIGNFSREISSSPFADDQTLISAIDGLQRLLHRLAQHASMVGPLQELLDFAHVVKSCSATMQCEAIFTKLQPMRARLFWTPVTLLSVDNIRAIDLVLLAQLYSVALAVDISLPELRGAALGSLTAKRIDDIDKRLRYDSVLQPQSTTELGLAGIEEAMQFPRSLAARYRRETSTIPSPAQRQQLGHQSPYGVHRSSISTPGTPGFPPGTPLGFPVGFGSAFPTAINRSAEDLSTPASPYLRYGTPTSRRQSQLNKASPNLCEEGSFDDHSDRGYSFHGESPAYSSSFHEDDLITAFRGHSPASHSGEFVAPLMWA